MVKSLHRPILTLAACLFLSLFTLFGSTAAQTENGSSTAPVQIDALTHDHSTHDHSRSITPTGALPTINLTAPTDGVTLGTRDVEITFEALNHIVGPIGTPHIHFHLDGDPLPYMMFDGDDGTQFGQRAVLFDFDLTSRATWVDENTVRFNALSNGFHSVRAHLVDGNHNIYDNPEATTEITFYVDVADDDTDPPTALVFVKERTVGQDMGRVFDNSPDTISDLYKLEPPTADGTLTQLTFVADEGGGVSDPEISYDGTRLLFSMRRTGNEAWKVWEINVDGSGLRQVTTDPPHDIVNDTDPVYLPDGRIMFASDRLDQRDEYNRRESTQLYTSNLDGTDVVLVEPNPSHDVNPQVIRDGRVIFNRWDHLAHSNQFSTWHMNPDGSSGFVFFGGVSPRREDKLGNAQGLESRQLQDGTMVGIFSNRDHIEGKLGIYDNRNGDLEDLPRPILVGPDTGFFRTPNTYMTQELIYSYSADPNEDNPQYGLYTAGWDAEETLVDDTDEHTPAETNATNLSFLFYSITLDKPSRIFVEMTGSADSNEDTSGDDDDAWLIIGGTEYRNKLERRLDGSLIEGGTDTIRVDVDLPAGNHLVQVATDSTPTINRVRIVRAARPGDQTLLYDDPTTNEISPIPVRETTPPPIYPSRLNLDLSYGTFLVRDVSLRGDFRQPNHNTDYYGDPDYHFHLDLDKLEGLRVFQSIPQRGNGKDAFIGSHSFEPVRVLGVAEPNEFGSIMFQAPANNVTAWHLIGPEGESIVDEIVWSLVMPGEVRACGGCHVPQLPFTQREIGPFDPPTDLKTRGRVYDWVSDITPILQESCISCHTGNSPAGGLDLTGTRATYENLVHIDGASSLNTLYIDDGKTRNSLLFQLLIGDSRGNEARQTWIDAINANVDHTAFVDQDDLYALGTFIDIGAGFAYLPNGTVSGTPQVAHQWPLPNSNTAARNSDIVIEFSNPIDRATVNANSFVVRNTENNAVVDGKFTWGSNRHVTFQPTSSLTRGATYQVSLSNAIVDIHSSQSDSQALIAYTAEFTVGSGNDTTAPTIDSSPSGTISPVGPILVEFSEAIDIGTLSELTFWVTEPNGAWVDGKVGVSPDGEAASFAPRVPLTEGATYVLHIGDGIRDLAGNALSVSRSAESTSAAEFTFTIGGSPATHEISQIADRTTGSHPEKLAVSRDGLRVAVANEGNDTVGLYDGVSWDLISTFTDIGDGTYDVEFSADSKFVYVLNIHTNDVRIVRASDGTTLKTVSGMTNPIRFVLNSAGDRLYVADQGDPDAIHEVDVDEQSGTFGTILRSLAPSHQPNTIAIAPDGQTLYYGSSREVGEISIPQWAERRIIITPESGDAEIAISPDGTQLVQVAYHAHKLMFVDLVAGATTGSIFIGDNPESVIYSPDGQFLYVTQRATASIAVFDLGSLEVIEHVPMTGPTSAEGLAFSPDGSILYATQDGGVGHLLAFLIPDGSDTDAPSVIQVDPAPSTGNVPLHGAVYLTFSEAVDRLTATDTTIRFEQGGIDLGSEVLIANDNRHITIKPSVSLKPNTEYTIRVTTAVEDLSGNTLANEFVSTFTTAAPRGEFPVSHIGAMSAGSEPRGMALSNDQQFIYVADYYANAVNKIELATGEIVDSAEIGHRVRNVVLTSDNSKMYVSRPEVDDIVAVDMATFTAIDTDTDTEGIQGIAVGDQPDSFLMHPSQPILYVVNIHSSDIVVIDTDTDTETARWSVFGTHVEDRDAHGVVLSPDGSKLYITAGHRLSVLDASSGAALHVYSENQPSWQQYGIAVTPDDSMVWYTAADTDELVGFDTRLGEITARVTVGDYPTWLTMSNDGETIYVSNHRDGSVSVVDWRTGQVVNTLTHGAYNYRIIISDDDSTLYVTNSVEDAVLTYRVADATDNTPPTRTMLLPAADSQNVSVLTPIEMTFDEPIDRSTVNGSTISVLPVDAQVRSLGVSGEFIVSADNRTVTFLPTQPLRANTTYEIRLFGGLTDAAGNIVAPQITQFATAASTNPVSLAQQPLSIPADEAWGMSLSPDGSELAITSYYWGDVVLYDTETQVETAAERSLGSNPRDIVYSADGSTIYVAFERINSVVAYNATTLAETARYENMPDPEQLLLSTDGNTLYATGWESGGVHAINLTSSTVVTQAQTMDRPGMAAYGPDGLLYVPSVNYLWRQLANGDWESLYTWGGYQRDIAFSADGRHAIISQKDRDRLIVVDIVTWRVAHIIPAGDEPRDMVSSADNRLLVLLNSRDATIDVIDTLTMATLQSVTLPNSWLNNLIWDEANGKLYVGETNGNTVHTFDLAYGELADNMSGHVNLQGRSDAADATVSLLSNGRSIAQTTTAANGTFTMKAQPGTYKLRVEHHGYLVAETNEFVVNTTMLNLPSLQLYAGDANADDAIDIFDLSLIAVHYGTRSGDPDWDARADLNGDGVVDVLDLTLAGGNYDQSMSVTRE